MSLTDTGIRRAKIIDKPYKMFDSRGLFLLVTPNGGKWWRFRYRFEGKEKLISLGTYPDVSLEEARELREAERKKLAKQIDPSSNRKKTKAALTAKQKDSFETVAREWIDKTAAVWSPSYKKALMQSLELHVFPHLGTRLISEIRPIELLTVLRRIEERDAPRIAHDVLHTMGRVFRYGVATDRVERDMVADLRGALPPKPKPKHFAAVIDPKAVGDLLRKMDNYWGNIVTRSALLLAPLVFVRPGELRKAE